MDPLVPVAIFKALFCIVIFVFNRKRNPNTRFLILFLLLLILLDVNAILQTSGTYSRLFLILFVHSAPLSFLQGPLLFFYVRSTLTDKNHLKKSDWMHAIPALFVSLDLSGYFLRSWEEKRIIVQAVVNDLGALRTYARGHFFSHYHLSLLRWYLWVFYLLYTSYVLYLKRPGFRRNRSIPFPQYRITYTWLLTLTISLLCILPAYLKVILDFHSGRINLSGPQYLMTPAFLLSMVFYSIAILSVLLYPHILYGMPKAAAHATLSVQQVAPSTEPEQKSEDANEEEKPNPFLPLANAIHEYLVNEKPFLQPDFNIATICQHFDAPQHHIYYCFSKILNESFPAYRNRLRVEYAKSLLAKGLTENLTIDAIGRQSGFNSRAVYFAAFRKETGMTPGEYLASLGTDANEATS